MAWDAPAILLFAALSTAAVILVGRMMRAYAIALLLGLVVLAGLWVAGEALRRADWHDIDGFIDCWPYCDSWQRLGSVWFWGPPVAALALVVAVPLAAALHGRRG